MNTEQASVSKGGLRSVVTHQHPLENKNARGRFWVTHNLMDAESRQILGGETMKLA
jgi:hypothetical protein